MSVINQVIETLARNLQQGQDQSREQFLAGSRDAADCERRVTQHDQYAPALQRDLISLQQF